MMSNQDQNEIRFLYKADYRISNGLLGGVSFNVHLIINTKTKKVVGMGNIFQAISPPLNLSTELSGDYSYMCTMESCNILVVAEGVSPFHPLIQGAPQNFKNVSLRMSLTDDWESGTATYQYLVDGEWRESGPQKVSLISTEDLPRFEELAEEVRQNAKEAVV